MGRGSAKVDACSAPFIGRGGQYTTHELERIASATAYGLEQVTRDIEPRLHQVETLRSAWHRAEADLRALTSRPHSSAAAVTRAKAAVARTRTALDRTAASLEAEIAGRMREKAVTQARTIIETVRTEAEADVHDLTDGPQRDSDRWVASHWPPNIITKFFRHECVNTSYDASLEARTAEAQSSVTMYQRLRRSYERLQPRAPEAGRLPVQPTLGDSSE